MQGSPPAVPSADLVTNVSTTGRASLARPHPVDSKSSAVSGPSTPARSVSSLDTGSPEIATLDVVRILSQQLQHLANFHLFQTH